MEFYIRIGVQFQGDKEATSCLLVLGEQSTAWKQTIKAEFKADKKSILVGLANISADGKVLQLDIQLGAAKKSLVRKGLKAWCTKAGLKLAFEGGEPDPTDIDTEEELDTRLDMPESNTQVQAAVNRQAATLQQYALQLQQKDLAPAQRRALVKQLREQIPPFLTAVQQLPSAPDVLLAFAGKMRTLYQQLELSLAEARLQALSAQLDTILSQLNPTV